MYSDVQAIFKRSPCRRFIYVLLGVFTLTVLADIPVFAEGNAEIILFKYQGLHQAYEWRVSETRMLATPEWNIDMTNIPIGPDKAWQAAKNWFKKQGKDRPDFVRIEIWPVIPESESTKLDQKLKKRFYYRVECSPQHHVEGTDFSYMYVLVLMDGSVLDPIPIEPLLTEPLK